MSERSGFSIKAWQEDDRPREKLLTKGRDALSDAELIAIIIGGGSPGESAVQLSQRLLSDAGGSLNSFGKFPISKLMEYRGIGQAKAISIVAAMELGRRRRSEEARKVPRINSSKDAFEILQPRLGELPHEEFWILFLNNSNKVIGELQMSKGGITGTMVDTRLVFKKALEHSAVGLILAHNHPSGGLKPSEGDKSLTQKLKVAGLQLEIKVLDHLIVTESAYFSFADEGLL